MNIIHIHFMYVFIKHLFLNVITKKVQASTTQNVIQYLNQMALLVIGCKIVDPKIFMILSQTFNAFSRTTVILKI